jgi:hypothetical protein
MCLWLWPIAELLSEPTACSRLCCATQTRMSLFREGPPRISLRSKDQKFNTPALRPKSRCCLNKSRAHCASLRGKLGSELNKPHGQNLSFNPFFKKNGKSRVRTKCLYRSYISNLKYIALIIYMQEVKYKHRMKE